MSFCEFLFGLLLVPAGFWASFGRFWRVIFLYLYWRLLFVFVFLNKSKSLWLKTCQNLCWGNANKGKRTSENPFNDKSSEIHISAKFSHYSEYFILSMHLDIHFSGLFEVFQVQNQSVGLLSKSKLERWFSVILLDTVTVWRIVIMLDTVIHLNFLSGLWFSVFAYVHLFNLDFNDNS